MILAIDPGTTQTAVVLWDGHRIRQGNILENKDLLEVLREGSMSGQVMAVEMIASYGMAVGREVFETCVWIGRFVEAFERGNGTVRMVYRKDVKMHLCHSMRAKDPNIRQALIDRFGHPGTKNNPGPLYGAKSHIWAALAVGVYAHDTEAVLS